MWSHGYYDTALWEKLLQEHLGDKILIKTVRDPNAPKVNVMLHFYRELKLLLKDS